MKGLRKFPRLERALCRIELPEAAVELGQDLERRIRLARDREARAETMALRVGAGALGLLPLASLLLYAVPGWNSLQARMAELPWQPLLAAAVAALLAGAWPRRRGPGPSG